MFNFTVSVYPFDELSEKAKQNAIQQHREFLLATMQQEDFISGCAEYDTPEELQKSYDSEYDYYLMNDEPIIESITINEYLFFADGELAHTCNYCAGGKSGETWIEFHGKQICIAKNQKAVTKQIKETS